jgi:hypothetical protein
MKNIRLRKNNQITLPNEAIPEGVSQFTWKIQKDGTILLIPLKTVPANEAWLYENPKLIASVRRGIRDAEKGRTKYLGSFANHAKEE